MPSEFATAIPKRRPQVVAILLGMLIAALTVRVLYVPIFGLMERNRLLWSCQYIRTGCPIREFRLTTTTRVK